MTFPQFGQPDKGDRFTPSDHPEWLGKLILFYPDGVTQLMGKDDNNQPSPYEVVEADVVIIDLIDPETGQPKTLTNARVGGKSLVPQIKKQLGGMVLGRLTQGARQAQKSGAFFLSEYSEADAQMAAQYIQAHPRQQFVQPQTQAPAYGAPQAAPAPAYQAPPPVAPPGYDVWQNTPTAPAPAGPPAPQWGAPGPAAAAPAPASSPGAPWGAPPAGQQPLPQGAPSPTAATAAPAGPALDPALVAFLQSKGVDPTGMGVDQATMIAKSFPA